MDNLDFLLSASIILSPNCVFLSDVSSILILPLTTEPCNVLIIAKYQYEYTFVLEKEICIAAMLNKLLEIC